MNKKVVFNGIEILTEQQDNAIHSLLAFVENIIHRLEQKLDSMDDNFNMHINMDFSPNMPIRHRVSVTNLSKDETRKKVLQILEEEKTQQDISGTIQVDLQVEDQ